MDLRIDQLEAPLAHLSQMLQNVTQQRQKTRTQHEGNDTQTRIPLENNMKTTPTIHLEEECEVIAAKHQPTRDGTISGQGWRENNRPYKQTNQWSGQDWRNDERLYRQISHWSGQGWRDGDRPYRQTSQ
jgi:ribosomal protein L44E